MSPLLLVGILTFLLSPTNCDVKHVLEGSAHPPVSNADPRAINGLADGFHNNVAFSGEAPGSFDVKGAVGSQGSQFWWMKNDSPLKHAYDYYKRCSLKGTCQPPVVVNELENEGQRVGDVKVDLSSNPFLHGGVQASAGTQFHQEKVDISSNPFLNGALEAKPGRLHAGNGEVVGGESFIGVQPSEPFGRKPIPTKRPEESKNALFVGRCDQNGYACVQKHLCVNGVIKEVGETVRSGVSEKS